MAQQKRADWIDSVLAFPYPTPPASREPMLMLLSQDYEQLQRNRSVIGTPMRIGSRDFRSGLGTHSVSVLRISSPIGMESLTGWIS